LICEVCSVFTIDFQFNKFVEISVSHFILKANTCELLANSHQFSKVKGICDKSI
jgi:hypothetical protein